MAKIVDQKIRFKTPGTGVSAVRVRLHGANTLPDYATPYDQVPLPTQDADGFRRVSISALPTLAGKEGTFDVAITLVDTAGNESDFLDVDAAVFDQSPPAAPTDGSIE